MSSGNRFQFVRYPTQLGLKKWKRMCARGREREVIKQLADLDMPAAKKRRLARQLACYCSRSEFDPLVSSGSYEFATEETDDQRRAATAGYRFRESSPVESSSSASCSPTDSTPGAAEPVDRSTELVESPLAETAVVSSEEGAEEGGPSTPERTRRSDDYNSEISKLSPVLSALKIKRYELPEVSEAERPIEDLAKKSNVPFLKIGKLHTSLTNTPVLNLIFQGRVSNEMIKKTSSMVLLVPSNVQLEVRTLVMDFADYFNCWWMECDAIGGCFDERVSHVIVDLEVSEPLKFAQWQAIGCRRYLMSAEWLRYCLCERLILPEDPYELVFLNDDTDAKVAAPSRQARLSPKRLFDGFSFLLCKPFVDFQESEMKRLLIMNGAEVCSHPKELTNSPTRARVCIVDSNFHRKGKKRILLKKKSRQYKFVVVRQEWLIACFCTYFTVPLLPYLFNATSEEAVEAGVPHEFLEDSNFF